MEYSDWWGYEIDMIELMAAKHGFTIIYDPPEDGLWGALEASGNMSGLIGQAAYNEVDMVILLLSLLLLLMRWTWCSLGS